MSNILNTLQYLKGKPEDRYLNIYHQETGRVVGPDNVFLADIPNEDLETYLKSIIGPVTEPTLLWIEMRTKNGTSSKKEHTCKVEIKPNNYMPVPVQTNNSQAALPMVNYEAPNYQHHLGYPAQGPIGLGVADLVDMKVKAYELVKREELYNELKEEHKNLKSKYEKRKEDFERKYDVIVGENRDLLSKLSVAESQKELAVMLAKADNKSFVDSAAFASLMERAPELIGNIAAMKAGGTPVTAGALGRPDLSPIKQQLVEFVSDHLSDDQVNFVGSVCHYIENESFVNQLKILIQQHHATV